MLSLLHIENIALIDKADIPFDDGFSVLTGETGAGKSIIIDAISAVIGERTSRELVRTGTKSALVTAIFRDLPPLPCFEEMGISPDENGELILSRKIQADGKNLCRIAGVPCTVVQLRTLGEQLVDIHGQHDGQQLLDEACHLRYLDSFGGLEADCDACREDFAALSRLQRKMDALQMDEAEKARRMDTLSFQIAELERANLREGEEEELCERKQVLRNADRLADAVQTACAAVSGDEDSDGAGSLLERAADSLSRVASFSAELSALSDTLTELRYAAEDAAERLRDLREEFSASPQELDEVEARLDVLYRLKKKYGGSAAEMLAYLERSKAELSRMELSDETLSKLERKREKLLALFLEKAKALSEKRKAAAEILKARIEAELRELDMPKVRFQVEFSAESGEAALSETGIDAVRFLMSANVGESLKPIAKVASGGELSRIMLALKNVLAENDSVMTLIFDEVDTGVSGRAAGKVAEKMSTLAKNRQVLCVTHLPQIASMADNHFSVQKEEREGRTFTSVVALDRDGRRKELARLTGGEHISDAILEGAEELLRASEKYKARRGV